MKRKMGSKSKEEQKLSIETVKNKKKWREISEIVTRMGISESQPKRSDQ